MEKPNGLRCRECGRHYEAAPLHVCEFCFGPLEVDYRYDALKGVVTRKSIEAGPPSMWRYKELLPIDGDVAVGHHVGFTPLIRAQNLADELGCREIWVKNDSVCHPTWSFKDRVVSVAVTKAREFGFDTVACASTGNLANSVAAHAAEGRLKSYIFIPADLEQGKVLATLVYNPTLVAVHGTYDEVNRLCSEIADKYRWAFVNVNFRPYYSEGSKSYGFEIVEQLGWKTPGHIIVPCAGGSLITKIWKAIKELKTLGLIEGERGTKMYAAQALGCGPIVTMIKNDTDQLVPVRPNTIAKSIAIGNPADGYQVLQSVRSTGGSAAAVRDDQIVDAIRLLAETEGIFTEPAGGTTLAATIELVRRGVIGRDEPIVVCITGNGYKTTEAVAEALPPPVRLSRSFKDFEAWWALNGAAVSSSSIRSAV